MNQNVSTTMGTPNSPTGSPEALREKSLSSFRRYSQEDRQGLVHLARGLRRAKRQLLLQQVQEPQSPVESLREIIVKVACDDVTRMPSFPSCSPKARSGSFEEVLTVSSAHSSPSLTGTE